MACGIKNIYIDNLDEAVEKYNKTYHRTIRMKPADFNRIPILTMVLIILTKILNSGLVTM